MKLFNTATRRFQEFKTIKKGEVGIYSCGPTVYWNQHIGHMYAYIQWDVLVKYFKYLGYKTKWVMNITDVGHMTSDEDHGEDKMEKGAKREGLTVWEIAEKYIKQFRKSMDLLDIKPDTLARVTDNIDEQINLIKKMEENGFTYKTKTGIVFDTSKFSKYPDFAKLNLEKQMPGARVEEDKQKKNPHDFLLWVTNKPNHVMQWDSPWGKGFPGWHIECTAISSKYLGKKFDIHTGGREHIPVHHTNEIAQSHGAFKDKTANYWLHNGWLTLKGEKMSKSLGNFYTITDLIKKGFDPMDFRYLILTSHYRKGIVFSWESLKAAQTARNKMKEQINSFKQTSDRQTLSPEKQEKMDHYRQAFKDALDNDLNTPQAIVVFWEMLKSNVPSPDKYDLATSFDEVLGFKVSDEMSYGLLEREDIKEMLDKRDELRKKGEFEKADEIRKRVEKKGFKVKDTSDGRVIIPVQNAQKRK